MTPEPDPGDVVKLPPLDAHYGGAEHPDDISESEAGAGLRMWQAINDLDDDSTGLPPPDDPGGRR
jgi:hypothetical protein